MNLIVDQNGQEVTVNEIHAERNAQDEKFKAESAKLIEERRGQFEEEMAKRCDKLDITFRNMGYQTVGGINNVTYQVGSDVYILKATTNGIAPVKVGVIG